MNWMNLDNLWMELRSVLLQDTPPLYLQLLTATIIYVAIRLWIWWRMRHKLYMPIKPEIVTGLWLVSLEMLSLGLLDSLHHYYNFYMLYIHRVFVSMMA